uniref:Uncharacterized protein n=1 Tax=Knipowitschia caucasica TaxID=637954 RepID=A0AAV2MR13_KNICA
MAALQHTSPSVSGECVREVHTTDSAKVTLTGSHFSSMIAKCACFTTRRIYLQGTSSLHVMRRILKRPLGQYYHQVWLANAEAAMDGWWR